MSKRKNDKAPSTSEAKRRKPGFWNMGLEDSASDPTLVVKSDSTVYIIKDKYPKAQYHYLVMPKENITSLKSVTSKHASLLKHMEDVALELTGSEELNKVFFKLGYHASPSMSRLHLHVISDDMNSQCLKTKKHWNSFTTDFFLKSEEVRNNLEKNGRVILPAKEVWTKYMEAALKCHKCDFKPKHMPDLKKHILTHLGK